MNKSGLGVTRRFTDIALDMASQQDGLQGTRNRVVKLAAGVGLAQLATLTQRAGATDTKLDAATRPELAQVVNEITQASGQGCVPQCLREHTAVWSQDFMYESRWPGYVEQLLARTPIRSTIAVPVRMHGYDFGALALYSYRADFVNDSSITAATILADYAALALRDAADRELADNLQRGLESNRRIGIAVGILMTVQGITDEQAFALLRRRSQLSHQRIADLAETVMRAGGLPIECNGSTRGTTRPAGAPPSPLPASACS